MRYMCCLGFGLFLSASGSLLHIFGTAMPEWESNDNFEKGLFEICIDDEEDDDCEDLDDLSTEERVVQALAIAGVVASLIGVFGATLFALLALFKHTPQRLFIILSALFCLIAFLCTGACVVYWSLEIYDDDNDLDVSFYLSACGSFLLAVGGLLTLFSSKYAAYHKA